MKRSEAIEQYRAKIEAAMVEKYRTVIGCRGQLQYGIYVWSDGDVKCLEDVQGGNSYWKTHDGGPYGLFYVTTIDAPCFDPWDAADHSAPEDDDEREKEEQELIDWYVDEYSQNVSDILDAIIDEAEQQEDEIT